MVSLFSRDKTRRGRSGMDGSSQEMVQQRASKPNPVPLDFPRTTNSIPTEIMMEAPVVNRCMCCGTKIRISNDIKKYKCSVCHTNNPLKSSKMKLTHNTVDDTKTGDKIVCSKKYLQKLVKQCYVQYNIYCQNNHINSNGNGNSMHKPRIDFEPLSQYLSECFHNVEILERSFINVNSDLSINIHELKEFYDVLMKLPSRKPFYRMICAANDLLKKPIHKIEKFKWIFIIWENPTIRSCLTLKESNCGFESQQIKAVSYELTKRCVGYLSNILDSSHSKLYLSYLRYLPYHFFLYDVETINLYLTYQLSKIYAENNEPGKKKKHHGKHGNHQSNPLIGDQPNTNSVQENSHSSIVPVIENHLSPDYEDVASMESKSIQNTDLMRNKKFSIKAYQYQNNWHILTACKLMNIYKLVNAKRPINKLSRFNNDRLHIDRFYNSMLDFIDFRKDFDNWEGLEVKKKLEKIIPTEKNSSKQFSFCRYSFLLSLGVKISIMEFETRKIMEYEAEMAFLGSLDKGKAISVYFKIKVRRNYLIEDSIKVIKENQGDFLKSLRVEFVGEPGIDAGGLRKEWFMLLTKELFSKKNSLFDYISQSRYNWFIIQDNTSNKTERNVEGFYYLFGVVIGLAIFNGVILDLNFPMAFYKILCNETVNFSDYIELYPETGENLKKLLDYVGSDFTDTFSLTFETTYKERFYEKNSRPKVHTVELCKGGSNRLVTHSNKGEYVSKWVEYYMYTSIKKQSEQFLNGFHQVFTGCNSIKLFNSEELERLVCGDVQEKKYDFQMLRSVTKYFGGFDNNSTVVNWFWEIVNEWDRDLQSRFLQFVTGSDRVPATGISTLTFKITKVKSEGNGLLPIAHTCFNELAMCEYGTPQQLRSKLYTAITESQGFEFR